MPKVTGHSLSGGISERGTDGRLSTAMQPDLKERLAAFGGSALMLATSPLWLPLGLVALGTISAVGKVIGDSDGAEALPVAAKAVGQTLSKGLTGRGWHKYD